MAKKKQMFKTRIIRAMKKKGTYDASLTIQIDNLASVMVTLDMADRFIEGLESPVIEETNKFGKKMNPHPIFRIQRDALEQVNRQMKLLKLTVEDIIGEPEKPTPIDELTEKLGKI